MTDVGFSLLGNGTATTLAAITYTWPKILYEVEGLFESAIKDPTKPLPPTHPNIIALKLELENNRKHIEAAEDISSDEESEIKCSYPFKSFAGNLSF